MFSFLFETYKDIHTYESETIEMKPFQMCMKIISLIDSSLVFIITTPDFSQNHIKLTTIKKKIINLFK